MKTSIGDLTSPAIRLTLFIISVMLFNALSCQDGRAQSAGMPHQHHPDFPAQRHFNVGLMATYTSITPPPALIGDLTYGISSRLSVGMIAGTTGAQTLAGLKLNSILFQRDNFRLTSRIAIVYYPGRNGKYLFDDTDQNIMPWMLSLAAADVEWGSRRGLRWSLGMGLLETHCVEGMKKYFWGNSDEKKVSPFEFFHTFQGSITIPLSPRLMLRPEVIVVLKDAQLIRTGDFKVFPINPFLKLIYSFD